MSKIIGILAENIDPAATLLIDGEVVAMGEEERFTRKKHAFGQFPINSVKYCLKEAGLELEDIDEIVYGWDANKYPEEMKYWYDKIEDQYNKDERTREWEQSNLEEKKPQNIKKEIKKNLDPLGEVPNISFVNHHKAHASSAFYSSGFDSAAVLTVDGHGEENTLVGWHARDGELVKVFNYGIPQSLGWFYASITAFLGFRPNNGEGKVMGLAAYGGENKKVREVMEEILDVTEQGYRVDPSYIFYGDHSYHERFTDKLVEKLGEPRTYGEEITDFHRDIAYIAQDLLEKALVGEAKRVMAYTCEEKLCIAGGVAYNCKANMRIREKANPNEFFVYPLAGEAGIPHGSALLKSEKKSSPKNVYHGYSATEKEIKNSIENNPVTVVKKGRDNIREKLVNILESQNIVARFNGRMECGPRALGNRSILADPRKKEVLEQVNKVKKRENWRPFAPSILSEKASEILEGDSFDPFMIQTYRVRDDWKNRIEAAVHVDQTTRPQVISRHENPSYYDLIKKFYERTSVPAVLNTSFNLSGDPIVRTPSEAIDTYLNSEIDFLQLENYLVKK